VRTTTPTIVSLRVDVSCCRLVVSASASALVLLAPSRRRGFYSATTCCCSSLLPQYNNNNKIFIRMYGATYNAHQHNNEYKQYWIVLHWNCWRLLIVVHSCTLTFYICISILRTHYSFSGSSGFYLWSFSVFHYDALSKSKNAAVVVRHNNNTILSSYI